MRLFRQKGGIEMQPYINPYYYNQYQQMPAYQQPNSIGISGKYVNDFSEISANDVPMNGHGAVFVKNDLSEIQTRVWNASGLIDSRTYALKPKEASTTSEVNAPDTFGELKTALQNIESRLSKIEYAIGGSEVLET